MGFKDWGESDWLRLVEVVPATTGAKTLSHRRLHLIEHGHNPVLD